ncbi:Tim44 domain-containing protein [Noviherbaspirillum sp.]|uniref:Tim44 domain-containing protein n=1 Tax=Noviherbaspirillum sp. TaxID=1926288 RepID=UPI002FDFAD69
MKKYLIAMMIAFSSMSVVVTDADAKRMGGGGSFGKQSQSAGRQAPMQSTPNQSQAPNASQAKAAPGAQAPKPPSPWRNILGGALLGLGLGALLSHLGIGGALASVISTMLMVALLAAAAFFIYRMVMRRRNGNNGAQPAFAGGYGAARTPEIGSHLDRQPPAPMQPAAFQGDTLAGGSAVAGGAAAVAPVAVPADFDVPAFLRHAKTYFIRLQAAWDRADISDIREFTTPEMFAELRMQLQERGASSNHTDVVSLDADLVGLETLGDEYLASVRFSGMIKEDENASAAPFAEIWNLSKPVSGKGGWILAGIQQIS